MSIKTEQEAFEEYLMELEYRAMQQREAEKQAYDDYIEQCMIEDMSPEPETPEP